MEDKKYNGLIVPVLTTIAATTATVVLALYLFTSFIPNPPQPETLVAENGTNQETIQTPEPEEETLMSEQFTETDDEVFEIPQPGVTLAINTTENPKLNENKKLTLTSEDNNKNNPLHDFIKKSKNNNKSRAYAALFRTWKRKFNIKRHASACAFAQTEGLSCLHKQGNLNSLRKINRPAVLRLYNKDGSNAYAIVTKLDDDKVTIDTGSEQFDLSASLLDAHWFGEFTLLWQTPPFYRKAVTSGSEGPIVQWLDQQMVRLYGQKDVPTINDTYSGNLVEQVKKFQQSKGLIPDGVAGPVTFIYLNSELGVEAPRLSVKDS